MPTVKVRTDQVEKNHHLPGFDDPAACIPVSSQSGEDGLFGYLAFSFIAGYNVDRFLKKMEDVAQSKFGVRPSRTSENSAEGD